MLLTTNDLGVYIKYMKLKTAIITSLVLLSLGTSNILAVETRPSAKAEKRAENITRFVKNVTNKFDSTIERLEKLIAKIESRITKIEAGENDYDLTKIKADTKVAKDKLSATKTKYNGIELNLNNSMEKETLKSTFKKIAMDLRGIKKELTSVHTMLVKIIGDIKGLKS